MIYQPYNAKIKLHIIATPIGNLNEVSSRCLETLKTCECILCEDTRVTSKLLVKFNINNKELISYQKFNEKKKLELAISKIKSKKTVLVSDAGYPCISDPGYRLVDECYKQNITIEVINGPSSIMHAVVVSGLNLNNFYFNGFLPASKTQRIKRLSELKQLQTSIICFESVYRIKDSLKDINSIFNRPYLVVCRELTKLNETIYRGYYKDIINSIVEKGEFVIIIDFQSRKNINIDYSKIEIVKLVKKTLKENNCPLKVACKKIALQLNLQVSLVYNIYIESQRIK